MKWCIIVISAGNFGGLRRRRRVERRGKVEGRDEGAGPVNRGSQKSIKGWIYDWLASISLYLLHLFFLIRFEKIFCGHKKPSLPL